MKGSLLIILAALPLLSCAVLGEHTASGDLVKDARSAIRIARSVCQDSVPARRWRAEYHDGVWETWTPAPSYPVGGTQDRAKIRAIDGKTDGCESETTVY